MASKLISVLVLSSSRAVQAVPWGCLLSSVSLDVIPFFLSSQPQNWKDVSSLSLTALIWFCQEPFSHCWCLGSISFHIPDVPCHPQCLLTHLLGSPLPTRWDKKPDSCFEKGRESPEHAGKNKKKTKQKLRKIKRSWQIVITESFKKRILRSSRPAVNLTIPSHR